MTHGHVPDQAQLPIALAVATDHEAQIVRRALRAAAGSGQQSSRFSVVQVGVSCSNLAPDQLVDAHSAVISTGFAGALQAGIKSGTLLIPEDVKKTDNTTYNVDSHLQERIEKNLHADIAPRVIAPSDITRGPLLHTDSLLATISQKQRARENTQCIACDMESASLAAAAKLGGRPFACLRIVLDPADTAIPAPIVALTETQTNPTAAAFVMAVLRHGQLAATATFLWHTFKSSRSLSRAVKKLVEGGCE